MLISFVLKENSLVLYKLAFFNFEKMRTLGAKIILTHSHTYLCDLELSKPIFSSL